MAKYQGPVRPGDDEKVFRDIGKTVPTQPVYQGPVRPGDDEKVFRDIGKTVPRGSGGGSSRRSTPPPQTYPSDLLQQTFTSKSARAQAEQQYLARQQRLAEIQRRQEQSQSNLRDIQQTQQNRFQEIIRQSQIDKTRTPQERFQEMIRQRKQEIRLPEIEEKKEEFYDSRSGMFVTPTGATSIMRVPTIEELDKIEQEKEKKSQFWKAFTGSKPIPSEDRGELDQKFRELTTTKQDPNDFIFSPSNIRSGFTKLGGYTLAVGEFLGQPNPFLKDEGKQDLTIGESKGWLGRTIDYSKSKIKGISTAEAPITREQASQSIGDLYMFSFFSPAMRKGTAQQSEYVYDYATGKFVKKKDLFKYFEDPTIEKVGGKTFVKYPSGYSDKAERFRRALESAKDESTRKLVIKTARETYGDDFIKEFIQQEGLISKPLTPITPPKPTIIVEPPKIVDLKGIEFIQSGAKESGQIFGSESIWTGTGQYEKTNFVGFTFPRKDTRLDSLLDTKTTQDTRPELDILSGSASLLDTKTTQDLSPRTRTRTRQDFSPRQDTQPKQDFSPKLDFIPKLDFKPRQDTPPRQDFKQDFFRPRPPRPTTKITKIPIPLFSSLPSDKTSGKIKGFGNGFKVFVKKKGEDLEIGEFETLKEAKGKLKGKLTETLRASGFISKKGKPLDFTDLKITSPSFRPSKKDSFRVVEKKERRLKRGTQEIPEIIKSRKTKSKTKMRFF